MAAIRKIVGRNRNLTSFNSNSNGNCSLIPPTLFISCRGIASKLFVGGTSSLSLNFLIYFHFEFKMILSWGSNLSLLHFYFYFVNAVVRSASLIKYTSAYTWLFYFTAAQFCLLCDRAFAALLLVMCLINCPYGMFWFRKFGISYAV